MNKQDSSIVSWITLLDIFGQQVYFTIDQCKTARTLIGGICSIFSILAILAFGIYSSQDFFLHLDPNISRLDYNLVNYISINASSFKIPFLLNYELGEDYTKYFTTVMKYIVYNSTNQEFVKEILLPLKNCELSDFKLISQDQYDKGVSSTSLCIDFSKVDEDIIIFGNYNEDLIGYYDILFLKCMDTDECASDDEIQEVLNYGAYLTLTIMSSSVDPYNYAQPISYYLSNYYIAPSSGFTKVLELYIKEEFIETDDGPIFKRNKTENSFSPYKQVDFFYEPISTPDLLANIMIYSSNAQTKTKRIFPRIQDILAQIGGIVSIILNGVPFIVIIFSWMKRDENILNKLIDFDIIEEEKEVQIKKPKNARIVELEELDVKSINRTRTLTNNNISKDVSESKIEESNYGNSKINTDTVSKDLDKKVDSFLVQWRRRARNKLKFTYCEIIKLWICPCCKSNLRFNKKKSLYYKSRGIINNYLEISYLIGKLDELEKLKFVVMNNKQLSLFKFISSDICSMDEKKMKSNPIRRNKLTFADEKKMAYELFQYKKELNENLALISGMDLRLLELMSDKFEGF